MFVSQLMGQYENANAGELSFHEGRTSYRDYLPEPNTETSNNLKAAGAAETVGDRCAARQPSPLQRSGGAVPRLHWYEKSILLPLAIAN